MIRYVFKPFVSALTVAAFALGTLSASTTPAAALGKKEQEILGALIGLGAVAIIVNGISKDKRSDREVRSLPVPDDRYDDRSNRDDRRDWRWKSSKKVIPAYCVDDLRARRARWDHIEIVSERCVAQGDRRVNLPRACAMDIERVDFDRRKTNARKNRDAHELRCLERHGYRVSRHR